MNDKYRKLNLLFCKLLLVCIPFLFFSCANTKNATYFNGLKEGPIPTITPLPETFIQKNDLLSITISSASAEAAAPFNTPALAAGILVDADGAIQIPILGDVKTLGLTTNQLKNSIEKSLADKKLLVNPIVAVRYLNYRVTVLGEVNKPSVINVPAEKISLLEAIGLAGDLTIDGKRENVLIIREEGGQRLVRHINLSSNEIFASPYYYLKPNDIVYVEPNRYKIVNARTQTPQWIPLLLSGLSLMIGVATFLRQ
jgi:polysaccharide export outer membrane protein